MNVLFITDLEGDYCEQVNLTENMCRIDARTIEKCVNKIERHRDLLR